MTDLDAIEKRAREARDLASHCSAGPWHIGHLDENLDHAEIEDAEGGLVGEIYPRGAQSLVVRSRMLLPDLADDVLALVAEIKRLRGAVAKAENICLRIEGEGGHGIVLHEMASGLLAAIAKLEAP